MTLKTNMQTMIFTLGVNKMMAAPDISFPWIRMTLVLKVADCGFEWG